MREKKAQEDELLQHFKNETERLVALERGKAAASEKKLFEKAHEELLAAKGALKEAYDGTRKKTNRKIAIFVRSTRAQFLLQLELCFKKKRQLLFCTFLAFYIIKVGLSLFHLS